MTENYRKLGDPLGGVKGDDVETTNPFSLDKQAALHELNISIDWIEGRKRKSDKTVSQKSRFLALKHLFEILMLRNLISQISGL